VSACGGRENYRIYNWTTSTIFDNTQKSEKIRKFNLFFTYAERLENIKKKIAVHIFAFVFLVEVHFNSQSESWIQPFRRAEQKVD